MGDKEARDTRESCYHGVTRFIASHEEIVGERPVVDDAADAVVKPAALELGVRLEIEEERIAAPAMRETVNR